MGSVILVIHFCTCRRPAAAGNLGDRLLPLPLAARLREAAKGWALGIQGSPSLGSESVKVRIRVFLRQ